MKKIISAITLLVIIGSILLTPSDHTKAFSEERTTNTKFLKGNSMKSVSVIKICKGSPSPKVNWSDCSSPFLNLRHSNLAMANLSGLNAKNAKFYNVNLQASSLKKANLAGADFTYSNLSGADLRGARVGGLDYSGVDISCIGHPICSE